MAVTPLTAPASSFSYSRAFLVQRVPGGQRPAQDHRVPAIGPTCPRSARPLRVDCSPSVARMRSGFELMVARDGIEPPTRGFSVPLVCAPNVAHRYLSAPYNGRQTTVGNVGLRWVTVGWAPKWAPATPTYLGALTHATLARQKTLKGKPLTRIDTRSRRGIGTETITSSYSSEHVDVLGAHPRSARDEVWPC